MTGTVAHATYADRIAPERVAWLWPGRLALGKLGLLDGDPGLGKSTLAAEVAARVSVGRPLPGGNAAAPGGVVFASLEDGAADTIVPRLVAAGADLSRVLVWESVPGEDDAARPPVIPADLPYLEDLIAHAGARLVVLDPLMAFLGGDVNSYKDQDVRRALAPLARLAERTGAAVLVLRHLSKAAGAPAIYRGGGSIGIVGAARTALLMARDGDDGDRRVLAPVKCNVGRMPPTLALRLADAGNGAARIEWLGEAATTADQALAAAAAPPEGAEERGRLDEAVEWLFGELAGGAVETVAVQRRAREAGITAATLRRAKTRLAVRSERDRFGAGGVWVWRLPPGDPHRRSTDPVDAQHAHLEHVEQESGSVSTYGPDRPSPNGRAVLVCAGCALPRSGDGRPCPSCGATDGRLVGPAAEGVAP